MIVATAGHIDHGKTSLLRALTGVDADRLPEERARGISIDLGFVHADLAPGVRVSFVDVPGHERFIRNMLAGVGAIDAALLVVAADDGVMPQTREHLDILDLLGVRQGIVVITKTDLVPEQRQQEVVAEVRALLAGTTLDDSPTCLASVRTGAGLESLRARLVALAVATPRSPVEEGRFRLCIDRAFSVTGHGTVVTGTVTSGTVAVGDHLVVSPAGREVRVRGVRVQDAAATRAVAGTRCAVNVSGIAVEEAGRGNWLVHPALHAPGRRVDVLLRILARETAPLAHWTPVHLHVGTADIPARVAIPGSGGIASAREGYAQLVLQRPVPVLHGDRFVVRDQSARRTLGGGIVLDPFAPRRQRRAPLRTAELEMLGHGSAARILAGLLEITEEGVAIEAAARNLNLGPEALAVALSAADAVVLGREAPLGITRAAADLLVARILAALAAHHASHPQASGMTLAALRKASATKLPPAAFEALVRRAAEQRRLVLSHDIARLRDHDATANPADERLWHRVRRALERSGAHAPPLGEMAERLHVPEHQLRDFLHRKSRSGEVIQIAASRFVLRETVAEVAASATQVAARSEDGHFLAADLRDVIGTGRRVAIHYLELLDRLGITQRFGDRRRIGKDFRGILGTPDLPAAPDREES